MSIIWTWIVNKIIQPFLPYILGGLVVAALLGAVFAYVKGYSDASLKCHDAAKQTEIDTLKRDMQAWKDADEVEKILYDQIEADSRNLQDKVTQYESETAAKSDAKCVLDDGDVRSLDGLRGNGKR